MNNSQENRHKNEGIKRQFGHDLTLLGNLTIFSYLFNLNREHRILEKSERFRVWLV
ncbi:hypothetical protein HYW82_01660 [Candidatus Peregrinibacteria bacterium]|nr:hypothetical protein [Candidatus Peregrinibacteria bacterium]